MKSSSATIQMKAFEQYFPVVMFITRSDPSVTFQMKATRSTYIMLFVFQHIYRKQKFMDSFYDISNVRINSYTVTEHLICKDINICVMAELIMVFQSKAICKIIPEAYFLAV